MHQIDPRAIKALALDLDGTILRPGAALSGRMLRTLHRCRERGIQLIICTGRPVGAAEFFRVPLGAAGPMVYFNGAEVVDMPGVKILETTLLEAAVVEYCAGMARTLGAHYQVFLPPRGGTASPPETLLIEREGPEAQLYRRRTGLVPVIGDIKKALTAPGVRGCIKGMFIAEKAVQDTIRRELTRQFGGRLYMAATHPSFLEIMAPGVSKGRGLEAVMRRRGLAAAEVLALGDEENDLPLFAAAGFSAAPASAEERIQAAATTVFGS
ncbi:MAG: HAD hydrolase family protein, partial [Treponema sp.]|nr:HAD hydrolase family protein [Treponema sp.]